MCQKKFWRIKKNRTKKNEKNDVCFITINKATFIVSIIELRFISASLYLVEWLNA